MVRSCLLGMAKLENFLSETFLGLSTFKSWVEPPKSTGPNRSLIDEEICANEPRSGSQLVAEKGQKHQLPHS